MTNKNKNWTRQNVSGNENGDGNRILLEAEKEDGADDQTRSSASRDGKAKKKLKRKTGEMTKIQMTA